MTGYYQLYIHLQELTVALIVQYNDLFVRSMDSLNSLMALRKIVYLATNNNFLTDTLFTENVTRPDVKG